MQMFYRFSYQCNDVILKKKTILQALEDEVSNISHHGLGGKDSFVSFFVFKLMHSAFMSLQ